MALAITVGGFLGQAVTQEVVTRGFSCVLDRRQERASMGDTYSRLELAHSRLLYALERSGKLPITDVSLLRQRIFIKRNFQECDTLLRSHQQQPPVHAHSLVCDDQQAQQGVIAAEAEAAAAVAGVAASTETEAAAAGAGDLAAAGAAAAEFFCSSFSPVVNTARAAVRSVSSALGITRDKQSLRIDDVKRFEWYADFAGKFMRDVESGCSIAHYRFFSPLVTQLLQGFTLEYEMVQASRTQEFWIRPVRTEDHGVIAWLDFRSFDAQIPTKCFEVTLILRLSENTDIVGIVIQCLQSVGPQFKSSAQVVMGELSQLPTQDLSVLRLSDIGSPKLISCLQDHLRPDPLCCQANVLQRACADNVIPSQLESHRFPEQLLIMQFRCVVSAFDQYNVQSSADEAERNVVNGWPLLKVQATFVPHCPRGGEEIRGWQTIGEQREYMNGTSVQQMGEMVLTNAITCFIRQPELPEYRLDWVSPHGAARFVVEKPLAEVQRQDLFVKHIRLPFLSEDV